MRKWLWIILLVPAFLFAQTSAVDLFFSEYIEGSSNNKALEIFNGTGQNVDLSQYKIYRYNNGSSNPSDTLFLSGILPNDSVYCIVNSSAVAALLDKADTTHTITFYNGDDAIVLLKGDTPIDIIGVVGEDPGTSWPVAGSGATAENTLVRKSNIISGNLDWTASAGTDAASSEWIVYPQNYFDDFGKHTFEPNANQPPVVDNGTVTFEVFEPGSTPTIYAKVTDDNSVSSVELYYYFIINDQWPTQSSDTVSLSMTPVTGDSFSVVLDLSNLQNGDGIVYWVEAKDDQNESAKSNIFKVLVGVTPISKAHLFGQDGTLMYDGFMAKTTGVVTASNGLFSNDYLFFQDHTGGVKVYNKGGFGGSVYLVGDSVDIVGYFTEFNSESEIVNPQFNVIKQGVEINPVLLTTTEIGESVEGMLVKLAELDTVAGGATLWKTNYFNLDMQDENGTITVRIASDSLDSKPEPEWPADITGVVTVFGGNYQILPRFVDDISTLPVVLDIEDQPAVTRNFEVYQNYPNPFNPTTTVQFYLPERASVSVKIFNALGQVVQEMVLNGNAGMNSIQLDGSKLASGLYFYRISYNGQSLTRKMMLIK